MARDLRALPKAHVHLHLEGAMRPDTLTDLCARHGLERPVDTRGQRFQSFGPFAATYVAACLCLREEADLKRLITEVAEDAANDGATWIEVAPSIELYAHHFGGTAATLQLLLRLSKQVEEENGVGIGLIISAARHESAGEAEALARVVRTEAEALRATRPHALVGFGLHADEEGNPPEPFARAFEIACGGDSPVRAMPHAGEIYPDRGDTSSGPRSVAFCLDVLGAARLGHGTHCFHLRSEQPNRRGSSALMVHVTPCAKSLGRGCVCERVRGAERWDCLNLPERGLLPRRAGRGALGAR